MTTKSIGILAFCSLLASGGLFTALAIVADVWLANTYGVEATISRGAEYVGYTWPAIPAAIMGTIMLGIGILVGHFWMAQPPEASQ